MNYLKQFLIIISISFIGEILNYYISLPIPASIYSLVIMLFCLITKIIPLKSVKEAADFLLKIMPVAFIPPSVGLMVSMGKIKAFLPAFLAAVFVSTVLTMGITGKTADFIIKRKREDEKNEGNAC